MKLAPCLGIVLRQLYLVRSNFTRITQMFIWVAVDMVLWGFMSRYLNHIAQPDFNFITVLLGAVMLWDIMIRIMQGTTMAYMEDSWSRNLFNVFVSPITVGGYLCGLVLSSFMTSLIGIFVMIILAAAIFGLSLTVYGLALLPFILIIFLFGIALGIVGCSLMLRMGPAAEWLVWPIPFVISPFAGVFYPLETLPAWMQAAAHAVPVSYVFENIRGITSGGALSVTDMLAGSGLSLLYIFLACLLFIACYRRAIRMGSIARYAAENF